MMTPEQNDQISECRFLRSAGLTRDMLREKGFPEGAIQAAWGRDPEHCCEYGAQNHHLPESRSDDR